MVVIVSETQYITTTTVGLSSRVASASNPNRLAMVSM